MSKKTKTFLTICGIVIGVGLIFAIVGTILGGVNGLSKVEERIPWVSFGGTGEMKSQTITVADYSSVEINNDLGTVELIESDKSAVEMQYDAHLGMPSVEVNGSTLAVESSKSKRAWFQMNLFGLSNERETHVKVYYPKGTSFKSLKVDNDLGEIKLNGAKCQTLDVGADAGEVYLNEITAETMNLRCDMGDIVGRSITSSGTEIKMSAGEMTLAGAFGGTTKVNSDMGECTLTTALPKDSYAMETKIDMGECTIDGTNVGSSYTVNNPAAKNRMEIKGSAGDINVNFQ